MHTLRLSDEHLIGLARWATDRMARVERPVLAERVLGVAGHRIQDPRARADVLTAAAEARLGLGHLPRHLTQAYAAELQCADEHHKAGHRKAAAASAAKALILAFHRVAHIDGLTSPLATDPAQFTGPLRRSRVLRALRAPRGRVTASAAPPADRPMRLLLVHSANDNFLPVVLDHYRNHPGVEVRVLDTAADPATAPLAKGLGRMIASGIGIRSAYAGQVEEALRPHLDWADVVFVDWCTAAAAFLTLVDPGTTRVVVRLHSFEVFSYWPHLVDFSRVDDLVFVSEHLRDLAVAALPRLREPDAPATHVLDNAVDLARSPLPKKPDARFTLGLVGLSQVAKDPRWALEVLRVLRRQDKRYRLRLIGDSMEPGVSPALDRYRTAFAAELAPLVASGAVHMTGHTDDIAAELTNVGVILSTSVRESWHLGLVEGAASGAVPVVRDWPFFADRPHGAHSLFPRDWVVSTPAEAAARILAVNESEESWLESGHEASEKAISTWGWGTVAPRFDSLLCARFAEIPAQRRVRTIAE
ncbi:glycosyltransferase [Streptomyces atroolivaceus]|uniref:Glycosyltransferase n=1 Tax=Streptomyces atroolivaceus TaxID=66869 RepID=A0ABV9V664_STRAZ|nr:glycosyltransferase [Streptomyces atroolivaceus]